MSRKTRRTERQLSEMGLEELAELYAVKSLANDWNIRWDECDGEAHYATSTPRRDIWFTEIEDAYRSLNGEAEYGNLADHVEMLVDHVESMTGSPIQAISDRVRELYYAEDYA